MLLRLLVPIVVPLLLFVEISGSSTSARNRVLSLDADNSCISCHPFHPSSSHPMMVPVVAAVELPLDSSGRIRCQTCHNLDSSHAKTGAKIEGAGLWQPSPQLCQNCHSISKGFSTLRHAILAGKVHSPQRSPSRSGVDKESLACLACHDGAVSTQPRDGLPIPEISLAASHPVGVQYAERASHRSGLVRLNPAMLLPAELRLFGNKIGCGSCHSMYSKHKDLLAVSNHRSKLCLACHQE